MRNVIGSVHSQIEHVRRARVFFRLKLLVCPSLSRLVRNDAGHRICEVSVNDYSVSHEDFLFCSNTDSGLPIHDDFLNGFTKAELNSHFFSNFCHSDRDRSKSTCWVENSVLVLEEGKDCEQAWTIERGHAEILGLERHCKHQSIVIEEAHQILGDGTCWSQNCRSTHDSLGEDVAWSVPRLLKASLCSVELLSVVLNIFDESICIFFTGKYSNSVTHDIEVACAIQFSTLSEDQAVVQVELIQFQFLVSILSDGLENFFDDLCVMEKCRSQIELESISLDDFCTASNFG